MLAAEPARPLPGQAPLRSLDAPARRRIALLLAPLLIAGGCAGAAEVTGVAMQQDLFQLRAEVAQAQQNALRAKTELEGLSVQLDRRVREQRADSDRQSAALTQRLDGLAFTLSTVSARLDELAAHVDALGRQLRAAGVPAPTRPAPAPIATPPPPLPPAAAPQAAPLTAPARPTTGALQPQDIYQAAYIDFSKGSYSLAIAGFREFLRRYPDHDLAGNAQYWIGEGYTALARSYANADQADKEAEALNQAVQEFRKVLANYPRADKASTALYKEALALLDLKQPQQAAARLQYLVDNFPQAEETPLAKERLAALKRNGSAR